MPRSQAVQTRSAPRHHNPLADDISTTGGLLRTKSITGKRKSRSEDEPRGDGYIDAPSSRKILAIAQDLADEDDEDRKAVAKANAPNAAFAFDSRFGEEDVEDIRPQAGGYDDEDDWMPDDDVVTEDVDPDDMAVYNKFLPQGAQIIDFGPSLANLSTNEQREDEIEEPAWAGEAQTTNLADLILQRIAEKEAMTSGQSSGRQMIGGGPPEDAVEIPAKVADVFQK